MMKERLDRFVARLPEREVDAVLVSAPENRRYLSGFTGSAGQLLVSDERAVLVTDSRYSEQATNQATEFQVHQVRGGWDWLMEQLKESGIKRLGFESQNMTVSSYNNLLDALKEETELSGVSLIPVTEVADDQRMIKDSAELALLQRAIDASDKAMELVCPAIAEGMTEREVAWRMEVAMRDAGADTISFDTIVAAGPNGAMAHHQPTDQLIKRGEPIVIDMGARGRRLLLRHYQDGGGGGAGRYVPQDIQHCPWGPTDRDQHSQDRDDGRGMRLLGPRRHFRRRVWRQLRTQLGAWGRVGGPRRPPREPEVDRLPRSEHRVHGGTGHLHLRLGRHTHRGHRDSGRRRRNSPE